MNLLSSTFVTNNSSFSSLFPNNSSNNKDTFNKKNNIKKPIYRFSSLLAIGNPIMDNTAEITRDILDKYNFQFGETLFVNDNNYGFFDDLESMAKVTYTPGGSIQNSVRVMSWCLNMEPANKKVFRISMLGSVGNDIDKKRILRALENVGVNPILETIIGHETSKCGVGIYQKEKFRLADIRASKMLKEQFIEENSDIIFSHDSLLIEGYTLNNNFNICKKIFQNFKQNKKLVFLTLSSTNIIKNNYQKLIEIANDSDIIIGNIYEAKDLAKVKDNNITHIYEIILKTLKPNNDRLFIITDLPNVVYCGKYDYSNKRLNCIWTVFSENIDEEKTEDFNGIGGAFFGGFLSQYMNGYDIHDCCRIGLKAANEITKNIGCIFNNNVNFFE